MFVVTVIEAIAISRVLKNLVRNFYERGRTG